MSLVKNCIICGSILRGKKTKYCSINCTRIAERRYRTLLRRKAQENFNKYKIERGCEVCGYNKCSASLDFHHLHGKDFRIIALGFLYQTRQIKRELVKCILLCKNCHYELHYEETRKKILENGDAE
jgi:hypothetical protein